MWNIENATKTLKRAVKFNFWYISILNTAVRGTKPKYCKEFVESMMFYFKDLFRGDDLASEELLVIFYYPRIQSIISYYGSDRPKS